MWYSHYGKSYGVSSNLKIGLPFVVDQWLSGVQHFRTPWTSACQASMSFIISWSLPKLMSIESVMTANHQVMPSFGIGMKTDVFQSCGHCWVFQICWHIECSTFTALYFRIWNSSAGIPSSPLALFIVMLPKAHLTSHSRMSGSRLMITPSWLYGSWRSFFCIVLLCILATFS